MFEKSTGRGEVPRAENEEIDLADLAIEVPVLEDKELGAKHAAWSQKMNGETFRKLKVLEGAFVVTQALNIVSLGIGLYIHSVGAQNEATNVLGIKANIIALASIAFSRLLMKRSQAQVSESVLAQS